MLSGRAHKVVVTGASGFIGRRMLALPSPWKLVPLSLQTTAVDIVDFKDVEAIVHLAGIAHRMDEPSGPIYYAVNRDLTVALAAKAKEQGVGQFIFISTVKVYGDERSHLKVSSLPAPEDDYGKSKLEAEQALMALASPEFKVAIIRPPLVYGPGVKGNIQKLLQWISQGYPLPFKGIQNARSMVYVGNLVALIHTILKQKSEGIFIAGDAEPISTKQLVQDLAAGLGLKPKLFSIPGVFLSALGWLRPAISRRLFGSYVIDNGATNKRLDFIPPFSTRDGLMETAKWYLSKGKP